MNSNFQVSNNKVIVNNIYVGTIVQSWKDSGNQEFSKVVLSDGSILIEAKENLQTLERFYKSQVNYKPLNDCKENSKIGEEVLILSTQMIGIVIGKKDTYDDKNCANDADSIHISCREQKQEDKAMNESKNEETYFVKNNQDQILVVKSKDMISTKLWTKQKFLENSKLTESLFWKEMVTSCGDVSISFYHNLLTGESLFYKPKDFSNNTKNILKKEILENRIQSLDPFTYGKIIQAVGEKRDECLVEDYIEDREDGVDHRTKVIYSEREKLGCVVLVESVDLRQNICLGSGVVVEFENRFIILTAAHCVTDQGNGFVQKMSVIRVRVPLQSTYDTQPNTAKFNENDTRFFAFYVKASDAHFYPDYSKESNPNTGDDFAMIVVEDDVWDHEEIAAGIPFTLVDKEFQVSSHMNLIVQGFPGDIGKRYELYESEYKLYHDDIKLYVPGKYYLAVEPEFVLHISNTLLESKIGDIEEDDFDCGLLGDEYEIGQCFTFSETRMIMTIMEETHMIGRVDGCEMWVIICSHHKNIFSDDDNPMEIQKVMFRIEALTRDIIQMKTYGNEAVLTYVNNTSRGQSGGAVYQLSINPDGQLQKYNGDRSYTTKLIGIHVAGYATQSKCTLIMKSHKDWMRRVLQPEQNEKDGYEAIDWTERISQFIFSYGLLHRRGVTNFEIKDLECLPVSTKIMNMFFKLSKRSTLTSISVDLKLGQLIHDELGIRKRLDPLLYNLYFPLSSITTLDIKGDHYNANLEHLLFAMCKIPNSIKTLDLSFTSIRRLSTKFQALLPKLQIKTLILKNNERLANAFSALFIALIGSQITTLDISNCNLNRIPADLIETLPKTKITHLNLSKNRFSRYHIEFLCKALVDSKVQTLELIKAIDKPGECSIFGSYIHDLKQLEVLNLNSIGNETKVKYQQILILRGDRNKDIGDGCFQPLHWLHGSQLKSLTLSDSCIRDDTFHSFDISQTNLESLDISKSVVEGKISTYDKILTSNALECIFQNLKESRLKVFNCSGCKLDSISSIIDALPGSNLEELFLQGNYVNNEDFKNLCVAAIESKLKVLDIRSTDRATKVRTFAEVKDIFCKNQIEKLFMLSERMEAQDFWEALKGSKITYLEFHTAYYRYPLRGIDILPKTNIKELHIKGRFICFEKIAFENLCNALVTSTVEMLTMEVENGKFQHLDLLVKTLPETKIKELDLSRNTLDLSVFGRFCFTLPKSKIEKLIVTDCNLEYIGFYNFYDNLASDVQSKIYFDNIDDTVDFT